MPSVVPSSLLGGQGEISWLEWVPYLVMFCVLILPEIIASRKKDK